MGRCYRESLIVGGLRYPSVPPRLIRGETEAYKPALLWLARVRCEVALRSAKRAGKESVRVAFV